MERPCQRTAPDCIDAALQRELDGEKLPGDEDLIMAASEGEYDKDDSGSSEQFICRAVDCGARMLLHEYFNSHDQKRRFIQRM